MNFETSRKLCLPVHLHAWETHMARVPRGPRAHSAVSQHGQWKPSTILALGEGTGKGIEAVLGLGRMPEHLIGDSML